MTIGIDPGHNGANFAAPAVISRQVWNGRAREACDTTGTETDSGYTEALFTFKVGAYLAADLRAEGARVVLTRNSNTGIGPCIDTRARILNDAQANVAIDIHADGGPATGRGFTVIEPVDDNINHAVLAGSYHFGSILREAMLTRTQMPVSSYDGVDGLIRRSDLAGLNLTTVPKVLIECGNMRNLADSRLLTSDTFQRELASTFALAVAHYLNRPG